MKNWKLFFIVLLFCGLSASIIPWFYNRSQLLTESALLEHRAIWEQNTPANYQLIILKNDGSQTVSVAGKIEQGQIIVCRENGEFLSEEKARIWSGNGIFDQLTTWLKETEKAPDKHYLTASFHPKYGLPIRVVFRSKIKGTRVELQVVIQTENESRSSS